ncbi:hypothetical protein SPRG_11355 [Saprolegnia parasitica CBS 223.65]|uniref:VLRF1 domain-containing protein n=1 Tax=Saprolegnia parasitica (strain CBS 223.65) TaxID=695850 RepID=A0A067BVU5_SAPPC|nr:hypothetical protein SPRG_11355 [Saprolegnia parasitica CBS 223.65]KDO22403.1 hypothetical protein SPRG_11355 [Saprolegnia parasitica CBS 223.65]|eukprot:XP_012206926.1 hypothetical protein SPRG_11355 [Saprolegnia parasitica CBS 223.65]
MQRKQRYGSIPLWELSNLASWRSLNGAVDEDPAPATTTTADPPVVRAHLDVRGLTCGTCRLEFEDVKEQQAHFKTDLHVYNLKRKSKGLDCVTLDAYDAYVASQATKTTTALAADSDDDDDEAQDAYRHPLDLSLSSDENDSDDEGSEANLQREPLQAFTDNTTLFKIYNASFPQWSEKDKASFQATTDMVQSFSTDAAYYQWAVFLFRAGRFAGAVFQKDKVLVHKAFQRYTTRRKQGGSQSAHDAAGGKAKSAGAQLRRYNEMALQQDISELLTLWKTELQGCKRIFLGSAKTSRGLFFEKTGLQADDPRIRKVPFGTLRPTYDEVCRVRSVLGSASYGPFLPSAYEPKPVAVKTPKKKPSDKASTTEAIPPAIDLPAEVIPALPTPALLIAVEAGDLAAVHALLADGANVNISHVDGSLRTPLHIASALGQTDLVRLLLEHGADPCALDDHLRVPYFLCASKETRNVYRRYRGLAPAQWDYEAAKIPDALTDDVEDARKARDKEKKKRAKERKQQQMAAERAQQEVEAAAAAARAARAALEAACAMCGEPSGAKPFLRLTYKYCSTACVNAHKRELMAMAAMKRFGS